MVKKKGYSIGTFSRNRQVIVESVSMDKYFNHLSGVFDADVTEAVAIIEQHRKKTGEKLSFTAWFMKCLAQAMKEYPELRTFRWRRWKTITFDDVDIKCMMERIIDGKRYPVHYVFRKVDKKSFSEIHTELRKVQERVEERRNEEKKQKKNQNLLLKLPILFRRWFIWPRLIKNPFKHKYHFGIVGISSVGMFGKGIHGWVLPKSMHQTQVMLGSIVKKPVKLNEEIIFRDHFNLTLTINHDTVDGGPAVEFVKRLIELLNNAYDLDEYK